MRFSKFLATMSAAGALIAVGVAAVPSHAEAWVVYRGGVGVWVPGPVVVAPPAYYYAPPPAYYAPPPAYYAPPPVAYAAPQRIWIPAHYNGPYFVPGHWS